MKDAAMAITQKLNRFTRIRFLTRSDAPTHTAMSHTALNPNRNPNAISVIYPQKRAKMHDDNSSSNIEKATQRGIRNTGCHTPKIPARIIT